MALNPNSETIIVPRTLPDWSREETHSYQEGFTSLTFQKTLHQYISNYFEEPLWKEKLIDFEISQSHLNNHMFDNINSFAATLTQIHSWSAATNQNLFNMAQAHIEIMKRIDNLRAEILADQENVKRTLESFISERDSNIKACIDHLSAKLESFVSELTRLTSKVSILEKSQQDLRILVDNSESQSGNDLKFLEGKIESFREQTARLVASAVRDINYQSAITHKGCHMAQDTQANGQQCDLSQRIAYLEGKSERMKEIERRIPQPGMMEYTTHWNCPMNHTFAHSKSRVPNTMPKYEVIYPPHEKRYQATNYPIGQNERFHTHYKNPDNYWKFNRNPLIQRVLNPLHTKTFPWKYQNKRNYDRREPPMKNKTHISSANNSTLTHGENQRLPLASRNTEQRKVSNQIIKPTKSQRGLPEGMMARSLINQKNVAISEISYDKTGLNYSSEFYFVDV